MSVPAYKMEQQYADPRSFETILLSIGVKPEDAEQFRDVIFPFELMEHQRLDIHSGLVWKRFGLFDEARCGKTAVMHALCIFYARYDMKSVVLIPPALFLQFRAEFDRIKNHGTSMVSFDNSPKKRDQLLSSWIADHRTAPDVLLMTKTIFTKHHRALIKAGYQALMYDECHMGLGKETNQIYHAVKEFSDHAIDSRLILSTGTPMPNVAYSAFPLVSLKTPEAYKSRRHFDARHVTFRQMSVMTPRGEKLISLPDHNKYRDLEYLNKAMKANSRRVTKREVLDLTAPNIQIVPVNLSRSHQSAYAKLMRTKVVEIINETGDEEMIDARKLQKLRQLALQGVTDPSMISTLDSLKNNAVIETVQALLDQRDVLEKTKVVLFANYNNTVELLEKAFRKVYNPAVIYGPNGGQENSKSLVKFKTDGSCRLLIANPISGGVGLTAGDVSDTAIFVEPVSTPGQFDQAASRVMLKGQTEPVTVYILKVEKTISPTLIDLMLGKIKDLNEVVNDEKSMFDSLMGKA